MLSLRSLALLILADHVKGFGTTDQEKIALNEIYNLYKVRVHSLSTATPSTNQGTRPE
jgi:hypothetical protein